MDILPAALQAFTAYKQFILWKPVHNADGSTDKVPIDYRTGRTHDPHDPAIWLDAITALQMAKKLNIDCYIGFVFTDSDPFWFFDLDKCLMPDGTWSPLAIEMFAKFAGCAIEISQSGKGLHIFGTGPVPEHGCKNKENGLELYTEKRFVALTGTGTVGDAGFPAPDGAMNWLVSRFFPPGNISKDAFLWSNEPVDTWFGPDDDLELIRKMLASKASAGAIFGNKASIQSLWNADITILDNSYKSPSGKPFDHNSADMALCAHLAFWTGKNSERMDRLFRQSKLYREKWEKREDYRRSTIGRAVMSCKTVYSGGRPKPVQTAVVDIVTMEPEVLSGNRFCNPTEQPSFFKGCIYVQSLNCIFVPGGQMLKPEQFKITYSGYIFPLDHGNEKTTTNAWEAFTESQAFRFPRVNATCFRPDLEPGTIINREDLSLINTYVPINTKRVKGDATPFLKLLDKLFPDEDDRTIMLSYMAAVVQFPGVKFQWMPIIQGVQGNGKSYLSNFVEFSVGHRYTHKPAMNDIGNHFNKWIDGKLFIAADEIYINDKKDATNAMKPLVTDDRIPITGKGADQVTGDNRANFIGTMNPKAGVRKTSDDRRYCVFFTPQQTKEDKIRDGMGGGYFPNFDRWAKRQDGFAIVNDYLRDYQISEEFSTITLFGDAPETTSTAEALSVGMGVIEQEVIEAIENDTAGFTGGWLSSMALEKLLLEKRIRLSRNKRKELAIDLGFIPHPALKKGRANNFINLDGGKPIIYIEKNHPHINLATPPDVIHHYLTAQGITPPNDTFKTSDERSKP